jgi:hypothetical protein
VVPTATTQPPVTTALTTTAASSTTSASITTNSIPSRTAFTRTTAVSRIPRATGTNNTVSSSESNFPTGIVAGITIFGVLACCIVGIYLLCVRRNKGNKAQVQLSELLDNQSAKTVPRSNQGYSNAYKFGSSEEIEQIPSPYYAQETVYHDPYVNDGGYVVPAQTEEYYAGVYDQNVYTPDNQGYYGQPNDQGYTPDNQEYYGQPNDQGYTPDIQGYYGQQNDQGEYYEEQYVSNEPNGYHFANDPKRETLMSTDSEAHQQFSKTYHTKRETMNTITSADSEDFDRYYTQAKNSRKEPSNPFKNE